MSKTRLLEIELPKNVPHRDIISKLRYLKKYSTRNPEKDLTKQMNNEYGIIVETLILATNNIDICSEPLLKIHVNRFISLSLEDIICIHLDRCDVKYDLERFVLSSYNKVIVSNEEMEEIYLLLKFLINNFGSYLNIRIFNYINVFLATYLAEKNSKGYLLTKKILEAVFNDRNFLNKNIVDFFNKYKDSEIDCSRKNLLNKAVEYLDAVEFILKNINRDYNIYEEISKLNGMLAYIISQCEIKESNPKTIPYRKIHMKK